MSHLHFAHPYPLFDQPVGAERGDWYSVGLRESGASRNYPSLTVPGPSTGFMLMMFVVWRPKDDGCVSRLW